MQNTLKLEFNENSAWAPTQRLLCSHRRVADVHGRAPWAGQNLIGDHLLGGHFKLVGFPPRKRVKFKLDFGEDSA